jgi:MYXO-CTERM domain-containing protein
MNQQNSYQEMLLLFGPPIPDEVAPSVVIVTPTAGQVFEYSEDFDLTITLDDDRRPQVLSTQVYFDDTQAADTPLINSTLTFPVNGGDAPSGHGLGDGPHTIRIDVADEAGNPASAEVTIEIVGSPFGSADETGTGESGGSSSESGGEPPEGTGSTGDPTMDPSLDDTTDEGCSCRAAAPWSGPRSGSGAAWLALLALGLLRRRA